MHAQLIVFAAVSLSWTLHQAFDGCFGRRSKWIEQHCVWQSETNRLNPDPYYHLRGLIKRRCYSKRVPKKYGTKTNVFSIQIAEECDTQ